MFPEFFSQFAKLQEGIAKAGQLDALGDACAKRQGDCPPPG
jgi:hypothetical protein